MGQGIIPANRWREPSAPSKNLGRSEEDGWSAATALASAGHLASQQLRRNQLSSAFS